MKRLIWIYLLLFTIALYDQNQTANKERSAAETAHAESDANAAIAGTQAFRAEAEAIRLKSACS